MDKTKIEGLVNLYDLASQLDSSDKTPEEKDEILSKTFHGMTIKFTYTYGGRKKSRIVTGIIGKVCQDRMMIKEENVSYTKWFVMDKIKDYKPNHRGRFILDHLVEDETEK